MARCTLVEPPNAERISASPPPSCVRPQESRGKRAGGRNGDLLDCTLSLKGHVGSSYAVEEEWRGWGGNLGGVRPNTHDGTACGADVAVGRGHLSRPCASLCSQGVAVANHPLWGKMRSAASHAHERVHSRVGRTLPLPVHSRGSSAASFRSAAHSALRITAAHAVGCRAHIALRVLLRTASHSCVIVAASTCALLPALPHATGAAAGDLDVRPPGFG